MNDKKIELISAKGAMGVTEFALLYFPESPPETAYERMWVWIRTSHGLKEKLLAAGWVKFQKLYTPRSPAWLSTWGNLRKNKQPKEPHEAFLREL
jgi:hypothetical protein